MKVFASLKQRNIVTLYNHPFSPMTTLTPIEYKFSQLTVPTKFLYSGCLYFLILIHSVITYRNNTNLSSITALPYIHYTLQKQHDKNYLQNSQFPSPSLSP